MSKEKQQTSISELDEFGLIDRITKSIQLTNKSTVKGVGDDAAILDYKDKQVVVTSDLLTEGIHFNLMYVPLKHLGYKSVVVNLSDVYAMNATPKQITVNIALSGKFSVEAVDELYSGIHLACEKYGVDLVGGDTTSSLTGLTISVTPPKIAATSITTVSSCISASLKSISRPPKSTRKSATKPSIPTKKQGILSRNQLLET